MQGVGGYFFLYYSPTPMTKPPTGPQTPPHLCTSKKHDLKILAKIQIFGAKMSEYGAKFKHQGQNSNEIKSHTTAILLLCTRSSPNIADLNPPPPLIGVSKKLKCIPLVRMSTRVCLEYCSRPPATWSRQPRQPATQFTTHHYYTSTAYCIWSVISPFSNLNRKSCSPGLFYHVPLIRDQGDWDWRLRFN